MMLTFNPIQNEKDYTVHHKDGNKLNNNLKNLKWITWKDHTIMEAANGNIQGKNVQKPKIGKFLSNGILIQILKGAQQSSSIHKAANKLNQHKNGFFYRIFPKTETPIIGHKYDLNDSIFNNTPNTENNIQNNTQLCFTLFIILFLPLITIFKKIL
jgi:hypothetical protein